MSPINVECPQCGKKLRVRDEQAGKKGKCPGCGNVLVVPSAPPGPPPTAAVRPATAEAEREAPVAPATDQPTGLEAQVLADLATKRHDLLRKIEALPVIDLKTYKAHWGAFPHKTVEGHEALLDLISAKFRAAARFMDRNVPAVRALSLSVESKQTPPIVVLALVRTLPGRNLDAVPHDLGRTGENEFTFGYYDT